MPLVAPAMPLTALAHSTAASATGQEPIAVKESGDGRVVKLRRRLSRRLSLMGHDDAAAKAARAAASVKALGGEKPRRRKTSVLRTRAKPSVDEPTAAATSSVEDVYATPPQSSGPDASTSTSPPSSPASDRPPVLRLASAPPLPTHYRRPASIPSPSLLPAGAPMVRRKSGRDSNARRSPAPSPSTGGARVPFPLTTEVVVVEDYFSPSSPLSAPLSRLASAEPAASTSRHAKPDASDDGTILDEEERKEAADEMGELVDPYLRALRSSSPSPSSTSVANERASALARLEAASSARRGSDYDVTPKPSQSSLSTEVGRRAPPPRFAGSSPQRRNSPPRSLSPPLGPSPASAGRGSWRPSRSPGGQEFNPPAFALGESSESLVSGSLHLQPHSPPGSPLGRRPAVSARRTSLSGTSTGGASPSPLSLVATGDVLATGSLNSLQLGTVQEQEPSQQVLLASGSSPSRRPRSRGEQTTVRPPLGRADSSSRDRSKATSAPPDDEVVTLAAIYLERRLGTTAMQRKSTTKPSLGMRLESSPKELALWNALQDGQLLCRLMNVHFPGACPAIDRRDVSTAHDANLLAFLSAATSTAGLRPKDLFRPDDLRSASPDGVRRVARTVIALRNASRRRSASSDDEASWGRRAGERGRSLRRSISSSGHEGTLHRSLPVPIPGASTATGIKFIDSPTAPELSDHSSEGSDVGSLPKWAGESVDDRQTPPKKLGPPLVSFAADPPVAPRGEPSRQGGFYADGKLAQSTIEVMTVNEEASPRSVDLVRSTTASGSPLRLTGLPARPSVNLAHARVAGRRHLSLDSSIEPLEMGNAVSRMVPLALRAGREAVPVVSGLTRGISMLEKVGHPESPRLRPTARRHSGLNRVVTIDSEGRGSLDAADESDDSPPRIAVQLPPKHPLNRLHSDGASDRPRYHSDMYVDRQPDRRLSADSAYRRAGRPQNQSRVSPGQGKGHALRQKIVVTRADHGDSLVYQLGDCIGRGQFGAVYRALNVNSGRVVAIKRIALSDKSQDEILQLANEVELLKQLSHPSVVRYEGTVQTGHHLNILLEYVENGSLAHLQKAFGNFPEPLVATYTTKILEGLQYLHSRKVVHCDLKAANILTTKNGNIKLSDFGVSLNLNAMQKKEDVSGTPNWMAPEVIKLDGATTASDIWSLACTIIELLTGWPPYGDLAPMSAMYNIVEDDCPPVPYVSPDLDGFLRSCFAKSPPDRPNAAALTGHAWLKRHWARELNPQDSIPFLRRLSQGPDPAPLHGSSHLLPPSLEHTGSSLESSSITTLPPPAQLHDAVSIVGSDVQGRQSLDLVMSNDFMAEQSFRRSEHAFVKSRFSKVVDCRLCQAPVRRQAVLCADCGLICHPSCAPMAPLPCDLRSQLLTYKKASQAPHLQAAASASHTSLASTLSQKIGGLGRRMSRGPTSPVLDTGSSVDTPGSSSPRLNRSVSDSREARWTGKSRLPAAPSGVVLPPSLSSSEATTSDVSGQFGQRRSSDALDTRSSRRKTLSQSLGAFRSDRKSSAANKENRASTSKNKEAGDCTVS